jgi:periplasmic protein TonB
MEQKKTAKADLENKKNIFFLVGLVLALGVTLLAFEWSSKPAKIASLGDIQSQEVEEEIIPVTRELEVQPPPPPPPPKVIDFLTIIDDDIKIDDELKIEDSEADYNTVIDINTVFTSLKEEVKEEEEILIFAEEPAEFPGGEKALYKYIQDNVSYPVIAQENGVQGKVYVKFVVNEQGLVSNAEIVRGVDTNLDREALRVINSMPKFKPARQSGRFVKVYYNALINFQLQ